MKNFFQIFVFNCVFFLECYADGWWRFKRCNSRFRRKINDLEDAAEEDTAAGWWTKTAVGGYGELHYNNNNGQEK